MTRRPPKSYSKQLHKLLVAKVRGGHTKTLAFRAAGVHPDTVWDWLRLGRERPDEYPQYAQLQADLDKAKAEAETDALDRIQAAAKADHRNWTADAWYLERTNPKEFAKRDKVDVEIEASKPLIQLNQLVLTDETARETARALLRRATALDDHAAVEIDMPNEDE
jgi:hypothetical protein